jgi:succinate dehydrogenase/fumarate reductase flavoprotein subunit
MIKLESDVLVIGSGGAGMYAALAAAKAGASVNLIDRSLIGRGGATIMAQMTVAVAMGEQCPDHWEHHLADTLNAGRGLCDLELSRLLCEDGPNRIRQMDEWGVGWARENGRMKQAHAPGHDRPRCAYVDFLNTGPAISLTLRTQLHRQDGIQRVGDVMITDISLHDGQAVGAEGWHLVSGESVSLRAKAVIIATGGLTRLYSRNSASSNMGGDGFALALRAGAELADMEFVQFFPIGHLAPRMIGMDPIMWDPFRYKLGGRLINSEGEEFAERYGKAESGSYVLTRDHATYAIFKEVEAGRGSPNGGAWLGFDHLPESDLRAAFGPVIDRIAKNGIDLTRDRIEVSPIAHYHMGGIRVNSKMETSVSGLYAAGEAVSGANGANRLSGNAITEALVFGQCAGETAAKFAAQIKRQSAFSSAQVTPPQNLQDMPNLAAMIESLQQLMNEKVGPFRSAAKLEEAISKLSDMQKDIGDIPLGIGGGWDSQRIDWYDLRAMLISARAVTMAALSRQESRGAQQREDFPGMLENWTVNQVIRLNNDELQLQRSAVVEAP